MTEGVCSNAAWREWPQERKPKKEKQTAVELDSYIGARLTLVGDALLVHISPLARGGRESIVWGRQIGWEHSWSGAQDAALDECMSIQPASAASIPCSPPLIPDTTPS